MKECKFCELKNHRNDPTYIMTFSRGTLFLNFNQIYLGRVMYIYNQHARDITEISVEDLRIVEEEIHEIACILRKEFSPDLINVASLGNHVQHLHWHIIPRYKSEPNWGNPPWPHKDWFPSDDEKSAIVQRIRRHLS